LGAVRRGFGGALGAAVVDLGDDLIDLPLKLLDLKILLYVVRQGA
jgi:hypothetical protein